MTPNDFNIEEKYNQGFPVPQLFSQLSPEIAVNTGLYIDFAKKAVSSIEPEIIQKIATHLGLAFESEKETEGEVCFINSEEVRPEFRLSFASVDLADYICAELHNSAGKAWYKTLLKTDILSISYPKDAIGFWELVKTGEKLRHDQGLTLP